MAKNPAFLFYPGDWRRDTQVQMASMQTRGIWVEMLCCMWDAPDRGKLEGSYEQLSRLIGCTIPELKDAVTELSVTKIADVTNGNDSVTVINRRMYQEEKQRKLTRLRVQKYRETHGNENCNAPVTMYPSVSSSVTVTKKQKKEFIPPSLDDVKVFFQEKGYRKDIAQKAFDYYSTSGWVDSKGNKVRNWKQKMIAVWMRDEHKDLSKPEFQPKSVEELIS